MRGVCEIGNINMLKQLNIKNLIIRSAIAWLILIVPVNFLLAYGIGSLYAGIAAGWILVILALVWVYISFGIAFRVLWKNSKLVWKDDKKRTWVTATLWFVVSIVIMQPLLGIIALLNSLVTSLFS